MTDMKQPEALRLANGLQAVRRYKAAAELRRQHAEIESLRAKLDELEKQEPVAVKNHHQHMHMVGPDDGGRISIDELSAIPIGARLYVAAGARPVEPAPAAQDDEKDAARLYPVVIDGLLWLCTKRGGTFKPVDDCAAVNPPLSWKNALAADKNEPTNGND